MIYEVTSRTTWEAAVEEAIRRRAVCLEKFGPAPHGWHFSVKRRRAGRHWRWALFFDPDKVAR